MCYSNVLSYCNLLRFMSSCVVCTELVYLILLHCQHSVAHMVNSITLGFYLGTWQNKHLNIVSDMLI